VLEDHSLVLGGGGVAGIAWITGLLAGLADVGQDVAATRSTRPPGSRPPWRAAPRATAAWSMPARRG
jgi:hypothetical protein